MNNGEGDRDEEGCILTLDFKSKKLNPSNGPDPLAFLLHRDYFSDADKIKVDRYIQNMHKNRNQRSIHKIIS